MARVLIVDDTDIVRRALEMALRRMGHATVSTSDPVEALAIARRQPHDLALVDYRMPRMDGATLFRELRASLGDACPAVLFVSASPADEVAPEVERIGPVAGYVKKPFHLDDLIRMVNQVIAGIAVTRAAAAQR
ncbi:response regulator [Anaeromyxobacter oryzae]|uniref:Response regulatory domain-containing protein n=1 Tax=Anaeromyxobacter oryzae TaxID=2918170 RepID=A0ABN6MTE0_9BACT|nr:response regulator [Anaeromyxobacter oryzae]BDG04232.1 hypothetical protein AMOR_32280 [Anaeromyxobacter oryzae]